LDWATCFNFYADMKKLLLIRHAKATHESGYEDFERPLKHSGLQDAAIMAGRLKQQSLVPQILVSSPALRTLSTANVFTQHLSLPKAEEIKGIYEADRDDLVDVVNQLPADYDFIGLVGHNPGISELLYYLAGQSNDMPTCGVALVDFNTDSWETIKTDSGKLVYFDYPKE
jgi:phosphohistidine phosphatase